MLLAKSFQLMWNSSISSIATNFMAMGSFISYFYSIIKGWISGLDGEGAANKLGVANAIYRLYLLPNAPLY